MFKSIFLFSVSFLFAACQSDKKGNNAVVCKENITDTTECCQNLAQDTSAYIPWLNGDTMHYLKGHFEGLINNKTVTGFAAGYQNQDSSLHIILSYLDNKKQKINGNLILDGKMQPNEELNFTNFDVLYLHDLNNCNGVAYHLDNTKSKTSFFKYTLIENNRRANGCLSFVLYKEKDDNPKSKSIPDSVVFKNIRFSAILN